MNGLCDKILSVQFEWTVEIKRRKYESGSSEKIDLTRSQMMRQLDTMD